MMIDFKKIRERAVQKTAPKSSLDAKLQTLQEMLATENKMDKPSNMQEMEDFLQHGESQGSGVVSRHETITDDGPGMDEPRAARVQAEEALVREVLVLCGKDYDALIRMTPIVDEQAGTTTYSPYAQAVRANPAVAEMVLSAERPALAALQVAMDYAPYAEFINAYGDNPQDIKNKLKAEFQQELRTKEIEETKAASGDEEVYSPVVTPFSRNGRKASVKPANKEKSLAEIFGQ